MAGRLPTTPTFVLPYKRFATPDLLARARRYLEESRLSYRQTVRHNRCRIGYPLPAPTPPADCSWESPSVWAIDASPVADQSVVDHGLVWRFLTWLGSLTGMLDQARAMVLKSRPHSLCHRLEGSVDPHKARSGQRRATLETARQLLQVIPEWEACYGHKFFPRFATRAGFG